MALNQKHHQRFKELEGDDIAQIGLLESILKDTEIISFKKETPTMEDIFIKAVNNA